MKRMIIGWMKKKVALIKATFRDFQMNKAHLKVRCAQSNEKKFASLRMLCHMLDKGMNNVNFEKGHSKGSYAKACTLAQELSKFYKNDPSFLWCQKIIAMFEQAQLNGRTVGFAIPRHYSEQEKKMIECFMRSRVSCRNFTGEKVDQDVLNKILSMAVDAPNGCCRQTTRFYITQDPQKIEQIVPCVAGITNFSNIPCLVAVVAEISFYDLVDKNLQYLDSALAAENFILAARLYNVYGTMCNIFQASVKDIECIKSNYGISNTENVTMMIAIGYPVEIPEKPVRRELASFVRYV